MMRSDTSMRKAELRAGTRSTLGSLVATVLAALSLLGHSAAVAQDDKALVGEAADLLFHLLVLLAVYALLRAAANYLMPAARRCEPFSMSMRAAWIHGRLRHAGL